MMRRLRMHDDDAGAFLSCHLHYLGPGHLYVRACLEVRGKHHEKVNDTRSQTGNGEIVNRFKVPCVISI